MRMAVESCPSQEFVKRVQTGASRMRFSKFYTRPGDAGKTRLARGQDIWKDSLQVEAYGTVDELNSVMGLARVYRKAKRPIGWRIGSKGFRIHCLMSAAFGFLPRGPRWRKVGKAFAPIRADIMRAYIPSIVFFPIYFLYDAGSTVLKSGSFTALYSKALIW